MVLVLAAFGFVSAWLIQEGAKCLHLRDKTPLYLALGQLVHWLLQGLLAGQQKVADMAARFLFLLCFMCEWFVEFCCGVVLGGWPDGIFPGSHSGVADK